MFGQWLSLPLSRNAVGRRLFLVILTVTLLTMVLFQIDLTGLFKPPSVSVHQTSRKLLVTSLPLVLTDHVTTTAVSKSMDSVSLRYLQRSKLGELKIQQVSSKEVKNPFPVVVRPIGGLGNQLFQYSAAYSVARKRNSDLYICLNEGNYKLTLSPQRKNLALQKFNAMDRSYGLDMFKIPHDKLLVYEEGKTDCAGKIKSEFSNVTSKNWLKFDEVDILTDVVPNDRVVFQTGYAYSEIFFKDYKSELMDLFTLDVNTEFNPILPEIESTESVSVHVRRKDFDSNPNDVRTMTKTYYIRALNLMIEKLTERHSASRGNISFFVFSDDIDSVKVDFKIIFQNLTYEMIYCSNKYESRIVDFYLMSKCKHNIVSAGSYSFWSAYLKRNPNKIIIAPLPKFPPNWFSQILINTDSTLHRVLREVYGGKWSYPKDWITVDPMFS